MTPAARNGSRRPPHAEFCPIFNLLEVLELVFGILFFALASDRDALQDPKKKLGV